MTVACRASSDWYLIYQRSTAVYLPLFSYGPVGNRLEERTRQVRLNESGSSDSWLERFPNLVQPLHRTYDGD
jgi:hypothetical protein